MSKTTERMARIALAAIFIVALGAGCGAKSKTDKGPNPNATSGSNATPTNDPGPGGVPSDAPQDILSELSDIHFDFDQYALRSGDREVLTNNARWIESNAPRRVIIEGHCDERGTVEYNLALGEKRARTAHEFLVNYGIPASKLETVSYGKERPLDPRHDEGAWAANRRAHFVPQQ